MDRLEFTIKRSNIFLGLVISIYTGAIAILISIENLVWFRLSIAIVIIIKCWHLVQLQFYKNKPRSIVKIWTKDNKWGLVTKQGNAMQGTLLPQTYKSSLLVILWIKTPSRKLSIFIMRDQLALFEYKALLAAICA